MMKFEGLPINSGSIVAPVCLYSAERHQAVVTYKVETDTEAQKELARFDAAVSHCSSELEKIAEQVKKTVGKAESEIFITQKHIMTDPGTDKAIRNTILKERQNAESAISEVFTGYEKKFAQLDQEYLRERATDIGEIRRRLLDYLRNTRPGFTCEGQYHCTKGKNRVIVAEELTVGMLAHMNFEKVRGIATEHGGITSHAAIIARSLGIPAVSGINGIMQKVHCGETLLVDGDAGMVYLDPDDATVADLVTARHTQEDDVCYVGTPAGMELMANASLLEDVKVARSVQADGIGLFRTEILFLMADHLLNEHEQYEYYRQVVDEMGEKPVTFRLLDVGGDKPLPFLNMEKEENPYLGWRGSRFLLGNAPILSEQVKALGRLSLKKKIRVLFPMVIDTDQAIRLRDAVREILGTVESDPGNVSLGAMLEVPSACLQAREILAVTDFASVGSNDLIQYLFAVDRNNELVSHDYNPEHPALWSLLAQVSEAAQMSRKPLSICGEMASQDNIVERLISTGIRSLSVTARLVPRVRNRMARHAGLKLFEQHNPA